MAMFTRKFESAKQEWSTPQDLFDKLNDEFKFTIDLAASAEDAKCPVYYTKEQDSLSQNWKGICWLNPPYGDGKSKLSDYVKKAFESITPGTTIVMLIPARTNTKWWHQYCMRAAEVRFILGRPKFGDAKHGLPQPLAIVVFGPHWTTSAYWATKFSGYKV